MRVKYFLRLIIFSFCFSSFSFASQGEISENEARAWGEEKGRELLSTLAESDIEIKFQRLDSLLISDVDLDYLGKFVMGRYWREMTPEQKEIYLPLFKRYSLALYKSFPVQFRRDDVDFVITKVVVEKQYTNVYANIELKKGISGNSDQTSNLFVEFRIHRKDGHIMITDLKIAETSFLLAYRSRFTQMITENDGDIEWFLEDLNDMTKSIEITNEKTLNQSFTNEDKNI